LYVEQDIYKRFSKYIFQRYFTRAIEYREKRGVNRAADVIEYLTYVPCCLLQSGVLR